MTSGQKTVAVGAATGVLTMLAALVTMGRSIVGLSVSADAGERLAYAAQWIAIAAAPLFFAVASVGNARFKGEAIDPTAGKESLQMIINGRVVDNTVQQYALFVAASFAVAASSTGRQLGVVCAAALIFVIMRFAFWFGYRIHPLYQPSAWQGRRT